MMMIKDADDFSSRMFAAINAMLLDMLAAIARKDYEGRRRRQAQGIAKHRPKGARRAVLRTPSATTPFSTCSEADRAGAGSPPPPVAPARHPQG
jgi:hypothetical protein